MSGLPYHADLEPKALMSLKWEADVSDDGRNPTGIPQHVSHYTLWCTEHGNVTRPESGGTVNTVTLTQLGLYAQRHLARHLAALTTEIVEFAR